MVLAVMTLSLISVGVALAPTAHAKVEAVTAQVTASIVTDANVGLGAVAAQAGGGSSSGSSQPAKPVNVTGSLGKVVSYANAQVGKRYKFATAGPNTFDCSGLVVASYRQIGISLPHQTGALSRKGRAVSRAQLQPGDLIFPHAGHVMIYIGGGQVVHATNPTGGVKRGGIYAFSYARRIVG